MANTIKRSEALCEGRIIPIERIFTINRYGQQINDEYEIKKVRELSKSKKLTCPCGCGILLHLVAPDNNTKTQHFAANPNQISKSCTYEATIYARTVLKLWLLDKTSDNEIIDKTPIFKVGDTNRKYEYSLLAPNKKVALNYWKNRKHIKDEKFEIQNEYGQEIKTIHFVHYDNANNNDQLPEYLIKIQKQQGYVLLLKATSNKYYEAWVKVLYYKQDEDLRWNKIFVWNAPLKHFSIDDGIIKFDGINIVDKIPGAIKKYDNARKKANTVIIPQSTKMLGEIPKTEQKYHPTNFSYVERGKLLFQKQKKSAKHDKLEIN